MAGDRARRGSPAEHNADTPSARVASPDRTSRSSRLDGRVASGAQPRPRRPRAELDKPGRDKLNEVGLIESHRSDGRFVHELTDRGWRLCRDILSADPPPRSTGPAKTLYTVLGSLDRYLRRADLSLADVFGADGDEPTQFLAPPA
jgi:hypothetical protein